MGIHVDGVQPVFAPAPGRIRGTGDFGYSDANAIAISLRSSPGCLLHPSRALPFLCIELPGHSGRRSFACRHGPVSEPLAWRARKTDAAVGELNASDARKTGIGSKAGISNTAVPAGLLNQIF
ncbi:hypothetical protein [Cupriavidus oxalaticus]|uniref:hypothetical protein n=1 Tax=Cupriavidus oxalaticus TaxID=96344 RepID=UPI00318196A7